MNYIDKIKKVVADRIYKKPINLSAQQSLVSFTFDDVDSSAFVNAGAILNSHKLSGTFYVSLSFLDGKAGNEKIFEFHHLENCLKHGHELACHTYSHFHAYKEKSGYIKKDVAKNTSRLKDLGINSEFVNFSYPYGEQTPGIKKLANQRFKSSRGITQGINRGTFDLNNLKSIRLYEQVNTLDKIRLILDDLKQDGGWLIFYTHDVKVNFSKYGCSPKYLQSVIDMVQEMDLEVKTVREITVN